jgi:hypothetical protein
MTYTKNQCVTLTQSQIKILERNGYYFQQICIWCNENFGWPRMYHPIMDFIDAIDTNFSQIIANDKGDWAVKLIGDGGSFWFAKDSDKFLFKLTWLGDN